MLLRVVECPSQHQSQTGTALTVQADLCNHSMVSQPRPSWRGRYRFESHLGRLSRGPSVTLGKRLIGLCGESRPPTKGCADRGDAQH